MSKKQINTKHYLTAEECQYYKDAFAARLLDIQALSAKIFPNAGKSEEYQKSKLHKVLKGELKITQEEHAELDLFANCFLVDKPLFAELLACRKTLQQIKEMAESTKQSKAQEA